MIKCSGLQASRRHIITLRKRKLLILYPGNDPFAADGMVYQEINRLDVELYTDKKDLEAEKKLEEALHRHGFFFNKTQEYIETEKLYEVLYEMEVLIDAE